MLDLEVTYKRVIKGQVEEESIRESFVDCKGIKPLTSDKTLTKATNGCYVEAIGLYKDGKLQARLPYNADKGTVGARVNGLDLSLPIAFNGDLATQQYLLGMGNVIVKLLQDSKTDGNIVAELSKMVTALPDEDRVKDLIRDVSEPKVIGKYRGNFAVGKKVKIALRNKVDVPTIKATRIVPNEEATVNLIGAHFNAEEFKTDSEIKINATVDGMNMELLDGSYFHSTQVGKIIEANGGEFILLDTKGTFKVRKKPAYTGNLIQWSLKNVSLGESIRLGERTHTYPTVITDKGIDTVAWDYLRGLSLTGVNMAKTFMLLSNDNKQSFFAMFNGHKRTVVKQVNGIWLYNSVNTFNGSSFKPAIRNTMYGAFDEAMTIGANRFVHTDWSNSIADLDLGATLDVALVIHTADKTRLPEITNIGIDYVAQGKTTMANNGVDFTVTLRNSTAIVKALRAGELSIEVLK